MDKSQCLLELLYRMWNTPVQLVYLTGRYIQEDRYRTIGVRYMYKCLGQGEWVDDWQFEDCAVPDLEWHHKLFSKSCQKMKGIISRWGVSDNPRRNLPIVLKVQCAKMERHLTFLSCMNTPNHLPEIHMTPVLHFDRYHPNTFRKPTTQIVSIQSHSLL